MIIDLSKFKTVAPKMFWHDAALAQIKQIEDTFADLASRHQLVAEVVGSHPSKSIQLPVVKVTTVAGEFTLRDNFNDVNLMAILKRPAAIPLAEFFAGVQDPLTWDWYLEQVADAHGYSWEAWTDEEMNDPRILRVRDKRGTWQVKKPEAKDRWMRRMSDPAWYRHDWSANELTWEGEFGPGVQLFSQGRAFAEGIDVTTPNTAYARGRSHFIIAVGTWLAASLMIERLIVDGTR